jgi:hypothetical protein
MARKSYREAYEHWNFHVAPIVVGFWFVMFLNLQFSGKALNFCFEGPKKGGF